MWSKTFFSTLVNPNLQLEDCLTFCFLSSGHELLSFSLQSLALELTVVHCDTWITCMPFSRSSLMTFYNSVGKRSIRVPETSSRKMWVVLTMRVQDNCILGYFTLRYLNYEPSSLNILCKVKARSIFSYTCLLLPKTSLVCK